MVISTASELSLPSIISLHLLLSYCTIFYPPSLLDIHPCSTFKITFQYLSSRPPGSPACLFIHALSSKTNSFSLLQQILYYSFLLFLPFYLLLSFPSTQSCPPNNKPTPSNSNAVWCTCPFCTYLLTRTLTPTNTLTITTVANLEYISDLTNPKEHSTH